MTALFLNDRIKTILTRYQTIAALPKPLPLVARVIGGQFSNQPFVSYLGQKYASIYELADLT